MPWVKLDDGFYNNPTNRRIGPAGRDLFIASLAWCAQGLTDGRIDKEDLEVLLASAQAKRPTVDKLVKSGRWVDCGDHFQVDSYLDFQPSRSRVLAEREAAKERQQRARNRGNTGMSPDRHAVTNAVTTPVTNAVSHTVSHAPPDPTRPPNMNPLVGLQPLAAATPEDVVDFDHHDRPQHDPDRSDELVNGVRSLRSEVFGTKANGA